MSGQLAAQKIEPVNSASSAIASIFTKLDNVSGLLSAAQVCEYIGCHPKTLLTWTQQNRITAFRMGRHYRYDPCDVHQFLRKRQLKAARM